MRRVLLRCDATFERGVGHLVRSVAVAQAARARGWEVVVAGTVDVPLARSLLAAEAITTVPTKATGATDLVRLARELDVAVVHVDDYVVGDVRAALHHVGVLLSSMEDGAFGRRPADVVVDSTLGAENGVRPLDGSGRVLLGLRYAPLRQEVARARRRSDVSPRRGVAALVVLGGTDPVGVAPAVVRLCAEVASEQDRVTVVAAPESHGAVRTAWAGPATLVLLPPQDDLSAVVVEHDLAISAAGTTLWEFACLGVPAGLVMVTENQRVGYERAVAAGMAIGLGTADAVVAGATTVRESLATLFRDASLRERLSATGPRLVDGAGADRIVAAWEASTVLVRKAQPDDAAMLLAWRNDPATRAASRTVDEVPVAVHAAWLAGVLADSDRLLLVAERQRSPVAVVRFDRLTADEWEVSLTVSPAARGHGVAALALAAGERAWRAETAAREPGAFVVAHVRPENAASRRLFEAAGYRRSLSEDDGTVLAFRKP